MSYSDRKIALFYVLDPMCSWCWAFSPTWQAVARKLKGRFAIHYLMGGLAADSDELMPQELQKKLQCIWHKIEKIVPGTQFNFDYWQQCTPRRSTYPACRAVIAARNQSEVAESKMILAIQHAYYLQAQNPSDVVTLLSLGKALNFDMARFEYDLSADKTNQSLMAEIQQHNEFGVRGFPSLVLQNNEQTTLLTLDFGDADEIVNQVNSIL